MPLPVQYGQLTPGQFTNTCPTVLLATHSPLTRAKQAVYEPAPSVAIRDAGPLISISGCEPQLFPCAISLRLIPTTPLDPKKSSASATVPGVAAYNCPLTRVKDGS